MTDPKTQEALAQAERLVSKWRERGRIHAVRPPGAKPTLAELNEALARASDVYLECANEAAELLATLREALARSQAVPRDRRSECP